jgi:hypothetical protein
MSIDYRDSLIGAPIKRILGKFHAQSSSRKYFEAGQELENWVSGTIGKS